MSSASTAHAADLLWSHWQAGTVMAELPSDVRPATRRDGYAIQSMLAMKARAGLVGWKIAATSKVGQAHIGVDGPLAGRLHGERTHTDGATISLAGNRMLVAEPEFTFRAGADIPPRRTPYTMEEVIAAMDALIPAIEVPDSRFEDFASAGAAQLIADNACAHEFVLGKPSGAAWKHLDLSRHPVHATIAGRIERDGIGSNVLDDPRLALVWIVNELSSLGITLGAGQVVTTGTCMTPLAIEAGDRMHADFGVLGTVSASFA